MAIIWKRIRKFLYAGYDNNTYKKHSTDINNINYRMLWNVSLFGMIAGAILLLISFLPFNFLILTYGYLGIMVFFGIVFVICLVIKKRNKRCVRYVWWALLIAAFFMAALMGSYMQRNNSNNAVTILVFAVALPLFFIDRPYVTDIIVTVMCAIFLVLSFVYKDYYRFTIDATNMVVFWVTGIITNHQIIKIKIRDVINISILRNQRDTDNLTGLGSRHQLISTVNSYLASTKNKSMLFILDLDNFKEVNDLCGHNVGDETLREVADVLKTTFRTGDCICRFGGDEFVGFFPDYLSFEPIKQRIESLIPKITTIKLDYEKYPGVGASIGVAYSSDETATFEELFSAADDALYQSKKAGKNICIYHKY